MISIDNLSVISDELYSIATKWHHLDSELRLILMAGADLAYQERLIIWSDDSTNSFSESLKEIYDYIEKG